MIIKPFSKLKDLESTEKNWSIDTIENRHEINSKKTKILTTAGNNSKKIPINGKQIKDAEEFCY